MQQRAKAYVVIKLQKKVIRLMFPRVIFRSAARQIKVIVLSWMRAFLLRNRVQRKLWDFNKPPLKKKSKLDSRRWLIKFLPTRHLHKIQPNLSRFSDICTCIYFFYFLIRQSRVYACPFNLLKRDRFSSHKTRDTCTTLLTIKSLPLLICRVARTPQRSK